MPQKFKQNANSYSLNDLLHLLPNPNVQLYGGKGSFVIYIVFTLIAFLILRLFIADSAYLWVVLSTLHNTATYLIFHRTAAMPYIYNRGKVRTLTLWEQLDNGAQMTATRKFYTAVPILLLIFSTHYTPLYSKRFMFLLVQYAIIIIAKLPIMHKIRLFGIGKY